MSLTRRFLNRKPRPKGWKRGVLPTVKRDRIERDNSAAPCDGQGYLLAPCLVLAAAAYATREAYHAAMYYMKAARELDARRILP